MFARNLIACAALAFVTPHPAASQSQFPFSVGEALEYGGTYKLALLPVGVGHVATLSVAAIDTLAGVPHWRFLFATDFSVPLYHDHSSLTSWTTVGDFISHRFLHIIDQSGYSKHDDFAIHPDSSFYRNGTETETHRTPKHPIDDLAFFYFLRLPSTTLEVGRAYTFSNYFRDDRNPVLITVLDREQCDLPNKVKAQCLVLGAVVDDPPHGMFMKKNNARIWISDDAHRYPVQIKSGGFTLKLKKVTVGK